MVHVHIAGGWVSRGQTWLLGRRCNLQLVKTTNGRPHGLPEGKKEANLRERLLSTGKSLGSAAGFAGFGNVRLDLNVQSGLLELSSRYEIEDGVWHLPGDRVACLDGL